MIPGCQEFVLFAADMTLLDDGERAASCVVGREGFGAYEGGIAGIWKETQFTTGGGGRRGVGGRVEAHLAKRRGRRSDIDA